MKKLFLLLVSVVCLSVSPNANAEYISYLGAGPWLEVAVTIPAVGTEGGGTQFYSGGVEAGMYNLQVMDGPLAGVYKGYCVDPAFSAPNSNPYPGQIIQVTEGSRYEAAAYLFGKYYSMTAVDAIMAAKVQLAIWELVWDFGGTYDLSAGNFQTTAIINQVSALSEVNALIGEATGQLANFTPNGFYIAAAPPQGEYYGKFQQDFIFKTPEPSVFLLLGFGLVGLAGMTVRRKI